ncbi:Ger(x)C family spore germination protein [Paenibacillus sp. MMS18-CY102]|uniref:Ger(x)C family spore germination protein n=1 Tax=Paenibacillus sp. MMS18-CY102 TaxID=2682849 RepID=UPI00136590F3|nr:Ger(x)C family spore germination protein [Paenibacillus sp. MMS18-CY102]MWC30558.1 Ger(x)C family spore germination protein [Paenibacillus sp. MMS18-CY102]
MNGRLRKFLIAGVLLWMVLMMTGCWNRIELNELGITSATGIDWDGEQWVVTYQVVIPASISSGLGTAGGGSPKSPVIVYSTKGKSIRGAMMHSHSESPRKLFFAHNRVVILSEDVARRGFDELMDVYFRNAGPRETVSMLITPGKARRVLEQFMQLQVIPGEGLKDIITSETKNTSVLPNMKVYQVAMDLTGEAKSTVLPEIYLSGSGDNSSLQSLSQIATQSKLKLGRLAVLHNGKMVGWMSRKQSLGASYLRNSVQQASLVVPCGSEKGKMSYDTIQIVRSSTKLKPELQDGRLAYSAVVHASGSLTESSCSQNLYKPETISLIEKAGEKYIRSMMLEAWSRGQQLETDLFGAAEKAHRKYPKMWKKQWSKEWSGVFTTTQLEVHVDLRIARMGLSNKSFQYLTNKEKGG